MGDRGISSSLLDLQKFNLALKTDQLISSENKNKMFSVDSTSVDYGFGYCLDPDAGNIYHAGYWSGCSTWTFYIKNSNEYFVVLSNNSYPKTRKILKNMFKYKL